jgi:hypothetical protein
MADSSSDPVIDDGHRRAVSARPDVPAVPTPLTREYGVRHPFVGAGMGFIAHEQLAAAVTNAGGLGVLGASPDPADSLVVKQGVAYFVLRSRCRGERPMVG